MFAKKYPSLDWWIEDIGIIEMGSDEHSNSWLRILNERVDWFGKMKIQNL